MAARLTKPQRAAVALEIATDTLEEIGCEVDADDGYDVLHERGESVWILIRVKVPSLSIDERAEHNRKIYGSPTAEDQ